MATLSDMELVPGNQVGHEHEVFHLGQWCPVTLSFPEAFVVLQPDGRKHSYRRGGVEVVLVRRHRRG
jgi:hypothetical protein